MFKQKFEKLTGVSWKSLLPLSKVDELIIEDLVDKEDLDSLEEILYQRGINKQDDKQDEEENEDQQFEDQFEDDLGIPREKWWEEEDNKCTSNVPEMYQKCTTNVPQMSVKKSVKNISKYIFLFTAISLPFIYKYLNKYLNKYLSKTINNGRNTRNKEFEESEGEILEL